MGFLRGLGTAICSLLLFLALSIFSVAFLVNGTVLKADFVNTQIDKLNMSDIAQQFIDDQIKDEMTDSGTFITDVATRIINTEEPLVKDQLHTAISSAYSYLLNKNDELNINISFIDIKQNLNDGLWQTAVDYLKEEMSPLSADAANRYVADIRQQIPQDNLPQALATLPSNLRNQVIDQYLLQLGGKGSTEALESLVSFSIDTVVRQYFNQYFSSFTDEIPDSYTIDNDTFDADIMNTMQDVRTYIGYFKTVYVWLIVYMIVMAGLIFLINWRNVRASLRSLGIDLLIFGILDLAGVIILRMQHISQYITNTDIPSSVITWAEGLLKDISTIMMTFSIGVLVAAIILMVLSFIVKKPEAAA